MRRAFTLLETVMAASIGLLVVLTSVGVLSAINRADAGLAKRAHEVAQLEVIHNIVSRAMTNISTSDTAPPKDLLGNSKLPARSPTPTRAPNSRPVRDEDNPDGSAAPDSPDEQTPPEQEQADPSRGGSKVVTTEAPRLLLTPDSRDGVTPMFLNLTGGGGSRQTMPQRLEVVLAQPPVPYPKDAGLFLTGEGDQAAVRSISASTKAPTGKSGASTQLGAAAGAALAAKSGAGANAKPPTGASAGADQNAAALEAAGEASAMPAMKSFRGAFELRPQPRREKRPEGEPDAYELWWRPLAPVPGDVVMPAGAQVALPPPTKIADSIAYAKWQAYQQLSPFDSYRTVWAAELPAYVTLEVQTVSGLYAKWMFEVDWVVQPEIERPAAPARGGSRDALLQLVRPDVVTGSKSSGGSGPARAPSGGSAVPESILRGGQPVRGQGAGR